MSRNSLFPCGFDPYLPLYPSIQYNILKLVSLVLFLTRDRVKSRTSRSRLVTWHCQLEHSDDAMWPYKKEALVPLGENIKNISLKHGPNFGLLTINDDIQGKWHSP